MESKILQVFYGNDALPYKDKERSVHYPIIGNAFQGSSNTDEIRFYCQELGNDSVTWVAVSKLPNGKIGSKILETYNDSTINEKYALLELSSFYTQCKGDVYISLQGYDGGVTVDYDSEEEIYEIHGTPTIRATGSIKLAINYATPFVGSGETENTDFQAIAAALGTKLNTSDGIMVVNDVMSLTPGNFDNGQYVYDTTRKAFYKKESGSFQLVDGIGLLASDMVIPRFNLGSSASYIADFYSLLGYRFFVVGIDDKDYLVQLSSSGPSITMLDLANKCLYVKNAFIYSDTFANVLTSQNKVEYVERTSSSNKVYATDNSGNQTTLSIDSGTGYSGNVVRRDSDGQLKVQETPSANNDAASKKYVDSQTIGSTENKVDKTNVAKKVYGTDSSGNQTTYDVDYAPDEDGNIVRRASGTSQIMVPLTPTANGHATSKKYVDGMGYSLTASIDSSTYVMTLTLKDKNNNTLSTQTIDFPLESVVVNGEYDSDNEKIILTLQNGNTIDIPVGSLVSGLVSDVQVGSTSIVNNGVANLVTNSTYNASTNKIATMNDLPSGTVTSVNGAGASGSHITVSDGPITSSGTLTIGVDSGYAIPSNTQLGNIDKNLYNLAAFDTIETDNADYDAITRRTLIVNCDDLAWTWHANSNGWYADLPSADYDNTAAYSANYPPKGYSSFNSSNTTVGCCIKYQRLWITTNGLSNEKPSGIIEVLIDSTYSYTEKVIKNQPLNTLDQQGSQWLRNEWEKTLNLFDLDSATVSSGITKISNGISFTGQGGGAVTFGTVKNIFPNIKVGKTYIFSCSTNNIYHNEIYLAGSSFDWYFNTPYTITQNDLDNICYIYGNSGTTATLTDIMLIEGDQDYPYKPYNGAIIHEKDLDKVAYTNVSNTFVRQTFEHDNTPVIMNSTGSNKNSYINFSNQGTTLGHIGVSTAHKPVFNYSGTTTQIALITDIPESQIASVDVTDDKFIKVAGTTDNIAIPNESQVEVTDVKGNTVVANQQTNPTSFHFTSWKDLTTVEDAKAGHYYLFLTSYSRVSQSQGTDYQTYLEGTALTGSDYSFNLRTCTVILASNNGKIRLKSAVYDNFAGEVTGTCYVTDLTQFFNGEVPSEVLTAPELFFEKYWHGGNIAYNAGELVSANGEVVNTGRNLFDYENVNTITGRTSITNNLGSFTITTNNEGYNHGTVYIDNLIVGQQYTLSLYALGNGNFNKIFLQYSHEDGIDYNIYSDTTITLTSLKTKYTFTFTAITKELCISAYVNTNASSGKYITFDTIMLNTGSSALDYEPYITSSIQLPELKSAGSVYDEIKGGKKITRLGSVNLGSLSWSNDSYSGKYATLTGCKLPADNWSKIKTLSAKYTDVEYGTYVSSTTLMEIFAIDTSGRIYVRSANEPTGQLIYELATPTEEDYTDILTLALYKGGYEEQTSNIPYTLTRNYDISIKDQVVTNVEVDRQQQVQIQDLQTNAAKKNVDNNFTATQTINSSMNDTCLVLKSDSAVSDIQFKDYGNNVLGYLGIDGDKKPHYYGVSGGKASGVLATENDLPHMWRNTVIIYDSTDNTKYIAFIVDLTTDYSDISSGGVPALVTELNQNGWCLVQGSDGSSTENYIAQPSNGDVPTSGTFVINIIWGVKQQSFPIGSSKTINNYTYTISAVKLF